MATKLEMNAVEIAHDPVIGVERAGDLTLVKTGDAHVQDAPRDRGFRCETATRWMCPVPRTS